MSPASVCPRVTLTIQISEVLFDAIQITAAMSKTTVPAFIGSALRETQVAFFAETPQAPPESDVAVLDVRPATEPPCTRRGLGALQRAILDHLLAAPAMPGVYDLLEVRKTMLHSHHGPAVSRAVHQLVRSGVLEPMMPTSTGFRPDVDARENKVRFVRRGAGL